MQPITLTPSSDGTVLDVGLGASSAELSANEVDRLIHDLAALRAKMTPIHPAEPPSDPEKLFHGDNLLWSVEGPAAEIGRSICGAASGPGLDDDVAIAGTGRGFADELRVRAGELSRELMRQTASLCSLLSGYNPLTRGNRWDACDMNWRRSSTMLHGVACLPAMLLALANPPMRSRLRISIAARPSRFWSASPPAAATTSMRGCLAGTSAGIFPAILPSWCRTCRGGLAQGHAICLWPCREGRPDARHRQPRHGDRSAAERRQVRRDQTHMDRQRHQRDQHLRHLADIAGQDLG